MPRYIDADKVVKWSYSEPRYSDSVNDRTDLRDFLLSLPTISPDEVRGVGKWIKLDAHKGMEQYKCSVCLTPVYVPECMGRPRYIFCPVCGAKMEVSEDA